MMWWGALVMLVVRMVWVVQWVNASLVVPLVRVVWAMVQVMQRHGVAAGVLGGAAV